MSKVMLAHVYTPGDRIVFPVITQYKYDGLRATYNRIDGLRSRTGKPLYAEKIEKLLYTLTSKHGVNYTLDGELMAYDGFEATGQFRRAVNPKELTNVAYVIYDVQMEAFLEHRLSYLRSFFTNTYAVKDLELDEDIIRLAPYRVISDLELLGNHFTDAMEKGYEGLMIRKSMSMYEPKRTKSLLKWKPKQLTMTVKIHALQPGTGKYEGMLGAFICTIDQNEPPTIVKVGTGFNDAQRKLFNTEEMIGKLITIDYSCLTAYNIPRFPVFGKVL